MPEPERGVEPEVVDDGEHVGGETVPVEVPAPRSARDPVPTQVEGDAVESGAQPGGEGLEDRAAESGGVGEQERGTVPSEVVVRDGDPVECRHPAGRARRP